MVKHRLLLGSIAFGVSFGLSLLTSRDLGKAFLTGMTTLPAAVVAAVVVERRSHQQITARLAQLKHHIQALQLRRAEAYESLVAMEAETQRVAFSLQASQQQLMQPQLMPASFGGAQPLAIAPAMPRRSVSWDLSVPAATAEAVPPHSLPTQLQPIGQILKPHELPTQIHPATPLSVQDRAAAVTELNQVRSEAAVVKDKIETNLKALQTELSQLQTQVNAQRKTRDTLEQELTERKTQKRKLDADVSTLKKDVADLEHCRNELEQYLTHAEAKKRELETGKNPLQVALKELQNQVNGLQSELRSLETQILDRRNEKAALDQQLVDLKAQQNRSLERPVKPVNTTSPSAEGNGSHTPKPATAAVALETVAIAGAPSPHPPVQKPLASNPSLQNAPIAVSPAVAPQKSTADLPEDWSELMVLLPEYEFEVLKAIVEQNHPAAVIKKIAEANLTMPELLIDSINERALDTVGDMIIEPGSGAGTAAIAREHLKAVKKLIKTYEYLVE